MQQKTLSDIISKFRRDNRLISSFKSLKQAVFVNLSAIFFFTGVEYFYRLASVHRTLLMAFYALFLLITSLIFFLRYRRHSAPYRQNDREICRLIEADTGQSTCIWQLFDLTQLLHSSQSDDQSLTRAAVEAYSRQLQQEIRKPVLNRKFKKELVLSLFSALLAVLLLLISEPMRDSAYRLLRFDQDFIPAASHRLHINKTPVSLMEGDSLRLTCKISGEIPKSLKYCRRLPGDKQWSELPIIPEKDLAVYFIKAADQDFSCFFASDETASDTISVQVQKYPRLQKLDFKITPPAYTGLPADELQQLNGDLTLYAGSRLDFMLKPDLPADSVIFHREENQELINRLFQTAQDRFHFGFSAVKPTVFSLLFYKNGRQTPKPIRYRINILPDEYPEIKVAFPQNEYQPGDENQVPLIASASDDFGITRAVAILKKNKSEDLLGGLTAARHAQPVNIELPLEKQAPGAYLIQTEIPLDKLQLLSGESAELTIKVYDNDAVTDPKSSVSQTILITMPTLEELFKTSDESYKEQKSEAGKQLEKSKSLREKIKKLADELKSNKEQPGENKNRVEQAVNDQQEMLKELDKLEESIKANMENLEKNSLLSKETMDKYRRLQKMVDELFNDEMKSRLEKLSELQKKDQVGKEELNQLLENLDEQQKKFQEGLEKTMQILEQIQAEYQLDKMLKTFNDLLEKQESVNRSIKEQDLPVPVLQDREKEIEKRYEAAVQSLKELAASESKLLKNLQPEISKTADLIDKDKLQQTMQEQQHQTGTKQFSPAAKTGQQVGQKLAEEAAALQALKDQFNKQQKDELDNKIAAAARDVLSLSFMTEFLKNASRALSAKSSLGKDILAGFADLQNGIKQTTETIFAIARQTFFIDNRVGAAIGRINQKLPIIKNILESRNFSAGAGEQVYLMADLNELFLLLNEARENLKNAESASGLSEMLKKMEELAKKQAELNQQSQGMQGQQGSMPMPGMQGSPGGQGQGSQGSGESPSDMMSRLAQEQAAIQDALNRLMSENGLQSGGKGEGEQSGGEGDGQKSGQGKGKKPGQGQQSGEGDNGSRRDNAGKLGKKLGGMSQSAEEIVNEMQNKKMTESILKKQDTLLKHMLETVKSLRQERFDNKRESEGGQKAAINPGKVKLEETGQTLREKMIRSLKEGYTREYQQKIREYFNELEK